MNTYSLEKALGYRFTDPDLLATALRHSSYVNEHPDESLADNERLEFLGDAALSLCVSHMLILALPGLNEGALSQIRANLVNDAWLADIARAINLGDHLLLGKGEEQSAGRDKDSILADAFEALLGAVFLDGRLPAVFPIVERFFARDIHDHLTSHITHDFKSTLQELIQLNEKTTPVYKIIREEGPDHDKTFYCLVTAGRLQAEGCGKSKKSAQQAAAREALRILQEAGSDGKPS
ncbi:MAG: ribonuclease III [Desulfosudaceae bacterium]